MLPPDHLTAALADRYRLERELGQGGMATVYLGHDLRHGRKVAVKVLRPELAALVGSERFLREIRTTANLQHPHILPLHDSGEAAGQPFYVMPFVEGESLRARLANGPLPLPEVCRVLRDVAEALAYAHARGIVHRDIKPDNVLLTAGAAVVADFGIAKAVVAAHTDAGTSGTTTGVSLGTPAYMAPEQAAADPRVDHRADIYAFGCMAYELLTGRTPFEGTRQQVLAGHLSGAPRSLLALRPEVPPALAALVMGCLEKEPGDRPQQAAVLVTALEAAGTGSNQTTGVPGIQVTGWKRAIRGAGIAATILSLALLVWLALRTLGIGPAGSLIAKGQIKESPLLLLTDFTVKNADSSLAGAVAEAVRTGLSDSRAVQLLGQGAVTGALRRMQRPAGSRMDVALARDIAKREGVEAIVDGEVTGVARGFIVTLRLVSADSGNVLTSGQETAGEQPEELIRAVDRAVRALRRKIGESLGSVRASQPLSRLTTSSLEALKLYGGGGRDETPQARLARLREVVALDSNFATAWRSLALTLTNLRYPRASIDSAITRAFQLRDRLTDRERYFVEAVYFGVGPYPDRTRVIRAYEGLIQAGDSGGAVLNNLGMSYMFGRGWAPAESLFKTVIARPPQTVNPYNNIVGPLFAQGKLDQAESLLVVGLAAFPREASLIMHSRMARYHRGRIEEYQRGLDSGRAFALGSYQRLNSTQASAQLAELGGRFSQAAGYWAEAAILDSIMGLPHLTATDSIREAQFDIQFRGKLGRGVARLDAERARPSFATLYYRDRPDAWMAGLYAMAGQPARARAVLKEMTGHKDTMRLRVEQPQVHMVLGEIALAEQRPRDAIVEFRLADRRGDGPVDDNPVRVLVNLGRAFDQAGQPDSAIAYYEEFLTTPYWYRAYTDQAHGEGLYDPPDVRFLPFVHERLGRLYEDGQNAVRAARHYRQFIELWKHADPELQPRVQEAKRRLTRLVDRELPR